SSDPLGFVDSKPYPERIAAAQAKSGHKDAVLTGDAQIAGIPVALAVMDFEFMGGSMGSVVGEKLTRTAERAYADRKPLVIVSASGGARMQEGTIALMQLAKTVAAVARRGTAGNGHLVVEAGLITDATQLASGRPTPWQTVQTARNIARPHALDIIGRVFEQFQELHGDRSFRDDPAIIGGIAQLEGRPVIVVGQQKGSSTEENIVRNFGMPYPEGYRKAMRLYR